ncbi:MAG: bacteriohemerythrin [Lachnospiraceae bacterium]|jgi:hemerythrin|nr:bacteriohemerythrin [Lachnospiraceae bacterium]MCI9401689.1 bacteriohemerythrin [Lachnospiraceae bacterium]
MATLWKDEYKVGIDKIDEQHRQLFDKIGNLLEIAKSGNEETNRRECMEIIDFLIGYTITHFEAEERLQRDRKYVSYEQHHKIHEEFKNTVLVYKEQLNNDFSAKTLKSFIGTLLAWLVNHVCICDRKIVKNIPLQEMESYADIDSFIQSVANKLLTEMYSIPIRGTKSCIYKGDVAGAAIVRTIAEGKSKHLFLYGMSSELAEYLYHKISGMVLADVNHLDDIEKSALMEIGSIISTYAMSAIDDNGTGGIRFTNSLYTHDYNETDYNITNSVILEITTDYGKMDILYSHLKP